MRSMIFKGARSFDIRESSGAFKDARSPFFEASEPCAALFQAAGGGIFRVYYRLPP